MRIETMIYLYGAICVSMIGFNMVYTLLLRGSQPRLERRTRQFDRAISAQLARLGRGQGVDVGHVKRLRRRLRRVKNLVAFELALRPRFEAEEREPYLQDYLRVLQPVALYLAMVYRRRESMQTAYYSYFLSRYMLRRHLPIQSLQQVLLEYMERDNLYCRVNALQALCAFGSVEHILTALRIQDDGGVLLHEKILTETLLCFTGEHQKLIDRLWQQLDDFSPHTQLAILNYIRFRSGRYAGQMLALMTDEGRDKEVRLAAIRYFGRYPEPAAQAPLLALAGDRDPARWEYATVSLSSLARYSGAQVLDTLKQALHSANWYVRSAAAASLEAHQVTYEDLVDIVTGSDRYAREIITYRLEARRMKRGGDGPA